MQGAMYSPEGVNIFIETDDENWPELIMVNELKFKNVDVLRK